MLHTQVQRQQYHVKCSNCLWKLRAHIWSSLFWDLMQQWQSVTDSVAAPVNPICKGSSNPRRLMHSLTSMPVSGFWIVEKIQTGTSAPWKWSTEQETAHCSRSKSHESSCPGGQTANDPKLKENQLNIKWDMTGQSPGCYVGRLCHAMSHWVGACEDVRSIHTTGDRYWGVAE